MILKELNINNYKNIESAHLHFSDKLNCIIGSNGMGKTNLLDSIFFLSFARSYVYLPDSMLIRDGSDISVLEGVYQMDDQTEKIFCGIQRGKSKVLKRNKKPYKKISTHIGAFPLVMTSPSDFELIKGGSDERRKFMDMNISQASSPYISALIRYKRLLEQRNSMLKQFGLDRGLLRIVDGQMASLAVEIISRRKGWLEELIPLFQRYYANIAPDSDDVRLRYSHSFASELPSEESIMSEWEDSLSKDLTLGYTTLGPHRDDLEMLLGDVLIRKVGSQGQNKTFLVALKFAQFNMLSALYPRITPLLLLDDVFDKLDSHRVDRIVQLVAGEEFGQIFMTDTNRKYLDQILSQLPTDHYSIFRAERGSFKEI